MEKMNTNKLLEPDGDVTDWSEALAVRTVVLAGGSDPASLSMQTLNADVIVIDFSTMADGRGFSLVQHVLRRMRSPARVFACGGLMPDQVSQAFQCGFTGVLVSAEQWVAYGEDAWLKSLVPVVSLTYSATRASALTSIWRTRALG